MEGFGYVDAFIDTNREIIRHQGESICSDGVYG